MNKSEQVKFIIKDLISKTQLLVEEEQMDPEYMSINGDLENNHSAPELGYGGYNAYRERESEKLRGELRKINSALLDAVFIQLGEILKGNSDIIKDSGEINPELIKSACKIIRRQIHLVKNEPVAQ